MSGSLGDFPNKLTTAAFEPLTDVLFGKLFTDVLVVVFVFGRVA